MYLGAKLCRFLSGKFLENTGYHFFSAEASADADCFILLYFFLVFQADADADADELISFLGIVKFFLICSKLIQKYFLFFE